MGMIRPYVSRITVLYVKACISETKEDNPSEHFYIEISLE